MIRSEYGHWDVSLVGGFNPDNYFGFVYEVVNTRNNKRYIGAKQFRNKHTKKPLKGRKNRRISYKESNWKYYTTSSNAVNSAIQEGDVFLFQILTLCKSRAQLTYSETNLQHRLEVLSKVDKDGERVYYNGVIASAKFICSNSGDFTEERRRRISENRDYTKTDFSSDGYRVAYEEASKREWWNDGTESYHVKPEDVLEGWCKGRLPFKRREYWKTCSICGKRFSTVSKKSTTCSSKCRDRKRRPAKVLGKKRECPNCMSHFVVKSGAQKYCNATCKHEYYKKERSTLKGGRQCLIK